MNFSFPKQKKSGQVIILATLVFLFFVSAIVFGAVNPVVKRIQIVADFSRTAQNFYISEAGVEDVVYRIKNNLQYDSTETISVAGYGDTTITVTDNGTTKTILSEADNLQSLRKTEATITTDSSINLNYGIQTGQGGFTLNGGARVNGNIYANGPVVATNGVTITGSVIAANIGTVLEDPSNDSPTTPPNSIVFRSTTSNQDVAQSFQTASTSPIRSVRMYLKKNGGPDDATVRIKNDSGGSPGSTTIASGTLSASSVSTSYGWVTVNFTSNPMLTAGTTYWLVIDSTTQHASKYYTIGANTTYANGQGKIGTSAGSWGATSPSGLDLYFVLYLGGVTSSIGGDTYVGGVVIGGDAWAHTVTGGSVTGALYCQSGANNNKACDTSRDDPAEEPLPVPDAAVTAWKAEAEAGGTLTGNQTVGWAGGTLGPKKIVGNLTVNGGGILTVAGTLWVTGTLTVTGGGQVRLASSYGTNSGVIITDSSATLSGGGNLSGSGQSGSFIMILSTSTANPAITLTGGAGAVILNAQNGTIVLNGGTGVKEAAAKTITASGGAVITYDSCLANVNFSSGPTGGGFGFTGWKEIE